MAEVLDHLDQHNIRWGIVTNKPEELARQVLTELGLIDRPTCLIGGDTTPECKPHPLPLITACELCDGSPEHTVYIGDAQLDIEAAHRASMHNIVAMYGYIPANTDPNSWAADHYIDHPTELIDWLQN